MDDRGSVRDSSQPCRVVRFDWAATVAPSPGLRLGVMTGVRGANFKGARLGSEAGAQVGDAQVYAAFSKRRIPVVVYEMGSPRIRKR